MSDARFKEIADSVNTRIARAGGNSGEAVSVDTLRFMCIGTDVHAPLLRQIVDLHVVQMIELIDAIPDEDEDEARAVAVIAGATVRAFWMGFEFGRREEERP